jgi:hypothetical protein
MDNISVYSKIFFTLFGSNSLPKAIVIIVPIEKIFKKIKNTFPLKETTKGWWERVVVKIGSSPVTILKIPSGSNYIRDCLNILDNPEVKGVIFLGYCASFSKEIKIGQIVIPTQALFGKRRINLLKQKLLGLPKNKGYKIALVQQLLLPRNEIKKTKAQLGDMETYFLYKFSKFRKIPVLALLIVTDNPLFYPFYCVSRTDKIKINSSIKKLMVLLRRYVYKFQKIK